MVLGLLLVLVLGLLLVLVLGLLLVLVLVRARVWFPKFLSTLVLVLVQGTGVFYRSRS